MVEADIFAIVLALVAFLGTVIIILYSYLKIRKQAWYREKVDGGCF